jgi:hypothetical protein
MWYVVLAFVVYIPVLISISIYNHRHRQKYDELMAYLSYHHPEIYEQISIKPVFGPFYSSGAYTKSIRYARKHEPLEDPVVEQLLTEYAHLSSSCIVYILAPIFLVVILAAIVTFFYAVFFVIGKQ